MFFLLKVVLASGDERLGFVIWHRRKRQKKPAGWRV